MLCQIAQAGTLRSSSTRVVQRAGGGKDTAVLSPGNLFVFSVDGHNYKELRRSIIALWYLAPIRAQPPITEKFQYKHRVLSEAHWQAWSPGIWET